VLHDKFWTYLTEKWTGICVRWKEKDTACHHTVHVVQLCEGGSAAYQRSCANTDETHDFTAWVYCVTVIQQRTERVQAFSLDESAEKHVINTLTHPLVMNRMCYLCTPVRFWGFTCETVFQTTLWTREVSVHGFHIHRCRPPSCTIVCDTAQQKPQKKNQTPSVTWCYLQRNLLKIV